MSFAASHETLVRHIQMLGLIPRSPAQITVAALTQSLNDLGYKVTSRTVQRDLNDISRVMPLECNDNSKPYGWKWARNARTHLPMMSLQEALTLYLVQQHLLHVVPPTMLDDLQPLFVQAKQTIHALGNKNQIHHWLNSVVIESPTQPLIAPSLNVSIQNTIYQAVFEQKPLMATYKAMQTGQEKTFLLHPLGMIQRGKVTYLGATVKDYTDIRLFALHRFISVDILYLQDAAPKNQQSWTDYLASGAAGFHESAQDKICLTAQIDESLATRLKETPLSDNQTIIAIAQNGCYQLEASVFDTWQLTWWILAQGNSLVVQTPHELRQRIRQKLIDSLQAYDLIT